MASCRLLAKRNVGVQRIDPLYRQSQRRASHHSDRSEPKHPELPEGCTDLSADGEVLSANFVKVAINVAERPVEQGNALHTLLRGWFGPSTGLPGTKDSVLLRQTSNGWEIRPDETLVGIQREVG